MLYYAENKSSRRGALVYNSVECKHAVQIENKITFHNAVFFFFLGEISLTLEGEEGGSWSL